MNRRSFIGFLVSAPATKSLPWGKIAKVIAPITPTISAAIVAENGDLFSKLVATTLRSHSAEISLNIKKNNALLHRLKPH
jgi:hypothetical protein